MCVWGGGVFVGRGWVNLMSWMGRCTRGFAALRMEVLSHPSHLLVQLVVVAAQQAADVGQGLLLAAAGFGLIREMVDG